MPIRDELPRRSQSSLSVVLPSLAAGGDGNRKEKRTRVRAGSRMSTTRIKRDGDTPQPIARGGSMHLRALPSYSVEIPAVFHSHRGKKTPVAPLAYRGKVLAPVKETLSVGGRTSVLESIERGHSDGYASPLEPIQPSRSSPSTPHRRLSPERAGRWASSNSFNGELDALADLVIPEGVGDREGERERRRMRGRRIPRPLARSSRLSFQTQRIQTQTRHHRQQSKAAGRRVSSLSMTLPSLDPSISGVSCACQTSEREGALCYARLPSPSVSVAQSDTQDWTACR
ncbi:hypothetical protein KIPB_009467, partial [Kipferlia bialata]|eukprot:g9467.t1